MTCNDRVIIQPSGPLLKICAPKGDSKNLGHTAALNTPEVLAKPSRLVLAEASIDRFLKQRAIGTLSFTVAFDHVGVEGLALWVWLGLALGMELIVFVREFCIVSTKVT